MTSPLRRFVGALALVVSLGIYVFFALAIGDVIAASKPGWVHFVYFVIAGLLWVPPAGLLIRWMYRPIAPRR